jgi:hypothetical protein
MLKGPGSYFAMAVFFSLLIVSPAGAGALILYELGTPDLGTAAAGRAAIAADAAFYDLDDVHPGS